MEQFRKTPRANFLDYNSGIFFITICTKDRLPYFGEIRNRNIYLTDVGKYVDNLLKSAHLFCEYVDVPVYVVMPNHIHLIVDFCKYLSSTDDGPYVAQRTVNPALRINPESQRHVSALSKYINSLKGAVTKYARISIPDFAWQGRYHDHLIRKEDDGNRIWNYIKNNVAKWEEDCFNPNN